MARKYGRAPSATLHSWNASSSPAGITADGLASTPWQWSARLINQTSTPATYTVTASVNGATANSKSLQFIVAGGEARNGSYNAFATNGTRQTLALNFDSSAYVDRQQQHRGRRDLCSGCQ